VFLSKRRGQLRATFSYTLGRASDNASGNGDNPEDYQNKDFNWGPSDFDRTHIVVGTWTWQLPFFNEPGVLGAILGGWDVSGIGRYQSGAPLTVTAGTSIGNRRADLIGDPYGDTANGLQYLDPAAFAPAPEGRRGNTTRGQFRGPGLHVWDVSLRKAFRVKGDVKLQFQADMFNVFNHTNLRFSAQALNLAVAQPGDFAVLNQAAPPRNVQLGLRLTF
jgi:hypothetical protein